MEYYKLDINSVILKLKTNLDRGLNKIEIQERLEKYGQNLITETKKTSAFIILVKQLLSPLMFILLIATILSLLVGELKDAIVISIAVIINTIVGFYQEWKAEKSAQSLKKLEVFHCIALREGKKVSIEAKNLVPGDIIFLSAGQKVPADIRLIDITNFRVEEAILTGESKPIHKNIVKIEDDVTTGDQINMAFSGTSVLSGKAIGIVIATGENTNLGKIATLVTKIKTIKTPLQQQMKRFSWFLGGMFLSLTLLVFILGLIRGISLYEIGMTSIAIGVAAIPEGLLVALTVILAIGMQRMLKRKALVRHLIAAETLGSVSVICTDKTGTLTEGKMQVVKIVTKDNEFSVQEKIQENINQNIRKKHLMFKNIIHASILNNDAQLQENSNAAIGHPTEIALLQLANKLNINIHEFQKKYPRISEIPFSSDLKYMATVHQFDNKQKLIAKGAPEKIFEMCNTENIEYFKNSAEKMAEQGLRILAFAEKHITNKLSENDLHNLNFIGLIGIQDPLRPQAKETVEELTKAGIKVVLVTGDHKNTARNIAISAGIEIKNGTITGAELDKMSEQELEDKIEITNIFARVDPRHKIRIVKAWQKKGHSVAMTGDGVNDAPALKTADIGVALGSGSDVAHEISDMVLLDNNLSSIDAAVKEGRTIFDNIRKVIVYLMADSFSEIILITGSLLMGLPLPILATQIFWINLVTDGLPYLALTVEPSEKNIMLEKPRKKNEPILDKEMKVLIFIIGIITDLGLFLLYGLLLKFKFELTHIRTIIFTALSIDSLFYIFSVRTLHTPIFKSNPLKNKWLIPAVLFGLITQLMVVYLPSLQKLFYTIPLNLFEWIIIISLSLIKIIAIEITKIFFIKK